MSILSNLISLLQSQGIFEYYLPFLITFTMFYALLVKSKIFGENKPGPQVSLIIALVAGIYVTVFTPAGATLSQFFVSFFAQSSVLLTFVMIVGITVAALATDMFLGKNGLSFLSDTKAKYIALVIVILVVLGMFLSSMNKMPGFPGISLPNLGISQDDIALGLLLIATGLIIWWTQKGDDEETRAAKKAIKAAKEAERKREKGV